MVAAAVSSSAMPCTGIEKAAAWQAACVPGADRAGKECERGGCRVLAASQPKHACSVRRFTAAATSPGVVVAERAPHLGGSARALALPCDDRDVSRGRERADATGAKLGRGRAVSAARMTAGASVDLWSLYRAVEMAKEQFGGRKLGGRKAAFASS